MLRVETSNLSSARGALRSRRLYAAAHGTARHSAPLASPARTVPPPPAVPRAMPPPPAVAERHEILPPRDASNPPQAALDIPRNDRALLPGDSWSVQLELRDEEIARLYAHGLARGATVCKKGMLEWRPLLLAEELQPILRRTRIVSDVERLVPATHLGPPPSFPDWEDTLVQRAARVQIPAPPRLPNELDATATPNALDIRAAPTLAPSSCDSAITPRVPERRGLTLLLVAALSAATAWFAQGKLASSPAARPPIATAITPRAEARLLSAEAIGRAAPSADSRARGPQLPTMTIADLPLLGATDGVPRTGIPRGVSPDPVRALGTASSSGPSRAELVSALSQVGRAAGSCGERVGPVRVIISFASSGVARSIRVSGSNLARETRSCLIAAASRARISPFAGDPVTVSKTL